MRLGAFLVLSAMSIIPARAVTMRELLAGTPPQERVYKATGGTFLKLYYFSPTGTVPREPLPAVVWIHGGAWVGGTPDGFIPHARYIAARGALGFTLEYRLLKPDGPFISDCIADCRSAIRYIRAHAVELGVDPQHIAVAGDSAGGHLAAALGILDAFDDPHDDLALSARPNALLLFNPVLDLTEGDWIRSAVAGIALADKKTPRPDSPEDIARGRALSPVFHVHPGLPPTLLMHGRDDMIVPWSQAQRLATALNAAGNRCEFVVLENTGHAFVVASYKSPESVVVDALRTADRFLASLGYLRGEPTLTVSPIPAWVSPTPLGGPPQVLRLHDSN